MSIVEEIKSSFKFGSMLTKLIYINLGVFIVYNLLRFFLFMGGIPSDSLVYYLAVPASPAALLHRPWTLLTYMFFHEGFIHILFNMLWLFWFGKLFLQFLSNRQLLGVYLLGGISGAILYIVAFNVLPAFSGQALLSVALGASASVLAIVVAVSTLRPNYEIYLLFLGAVKLKYLAIATIVLDVISIPMSNAGGHIAHLGGAIFGYTYIKLLASNVDMANFLKVFSEIKIPNFSRRSKMRVTYTKEESDYDYNYRKAQEQKEIDKILEKIARSGYESLTKAEKELLFKMKK
ncbi:MAG TPA: rhomboid family intramembrane serine protease [Tenuifilaceae bacterium]|nr:rhomboid family intramembrane serine protease [Tenuifilaceae bacterium]